MRRSIALDELAVDAAKVAWHSPIQYGRGSVLTMDLTNRCNMMCDPCFMDAGRVGYIHDGSGHINIGGSAMPSRESLANDQFARLKANAAARANADTRQ